MIVRKGIGISIEKMPYRKKPCLCIYEESKNRTTKVASFNSEETAEWFRKMVENRFFEGMIQPKEENA